MTSAIWRMNVCWRTVPMRAMFGAGLAVAKALRHERLAQAPLKKLKACQ